MDNYVYLIAPIAGMLTERNPSGLYLRSSS